MGPDATKTFLKKNSDRIPAGEEVAAVLLAEAKGGAWRRGMRAAGPVTDAVATVQQGRSKGPDEGDAGEWPDSQAFWLVLTDKQLHVFAGAVGQSRLGEGSAHYPLERIASMDFEKKLLISKLNVTFKDGSSIVLDVAKQKIKPFVEAVEARSALA